jgi:predicted DsbA family dithiol-disulfide isomerase
MQGPLIIKYYTDILCVWAWISQQRILELEKNWGDKVQLCPHYIDLFGDTATRIGKAWQDKGGFEGFGQHVIHSAAPYEHAQVNPEIWKSVRPASSLPAHLILKATELAYSPQKALGFAAVVRQNFFVEAQDIGTTTTLLAIAKEHGLDTHQLTNLIENGTAAAALARDYQAAQKAGLKGSPSWVMNEGRQILYGNVGYRILDANVREVIDRPDHQASWC